MYALQHMEKGIQGINVRLCGGIVSDGRLRVYFQASHASLLQGSSPNINSVSLSLVSVDNALISDGGIS